VIFSDNINRPKDEWPIGAPVCGRSLGDVIIKISFDSWLRQQNFIFDWINNTIITRQLKGSKIWLEITP